MQHTGQARAAEMASAVPAARYSKRRDRSRFGQNSGARGRIWVKQSAVLSCAGVRFEWCARRTRDPIKRGATRAGARGRDRLGSTCSREKSIGIRSVLGRTWADQGQTKCSARVRRRAVRTACAAYPCSEITRSYTRRRARTRDGVGQDSH